MLKKDLNLKERLADAKHVKCPKDGCKNEAQVHMRYGILPCEECQAKDRQGAGLNDLPEFATQKQTDRVQGERDKHSQDFIPPWVGKEQKPNPDFVKQYPQRAKDYFSKEQLSKL